MNVYEDHLAISIHAPTRGATTQLLQNGSCIGNFNPRSHKGSDYEDDKIFDLLDISIHAPTRGATFRKEPYQAYPVISIHAPTRGATYIHSSLFLLPVFQSTLPQGERRITFMSIDRYLAISIHAPTRGATQMMLAAIADSTHFNPRSHKGSDICPFTIYTHD